ncbi:hypothetical protein LA080_009502 [Diaporthe eres]|nr:hypothetical protein LA080_009502 [Diaporthe eres]
MSGGEMRVMNGKGSHIWDGFLTRRQLQPQTCGAAWLHIFELLKYPRWFRPARTREWILLISSRGIQWCFSSTA